MMLGLLERADRAKIAIVCGAERIRYDALLSRVQRCAAGLQSLGVGEGDCVAIVLHNCPEFIITFFAATSLGAIVLPLNPQYRSEELGRFLADAEPRVIISGSRAINVLRDQIKSSAQIICIGTEIAGTTPWDTLLDKSSNSMPRVIRHGRALYLYTSGTTDSYKRICCTQENLYWEARNFVETASLTADDTILCSIPLFHSYGIGNCLLDAAYAGATLVLLPFEADSKGAELPFANRCHKVAGLFREENVRFFPGVPYQFSVLASLPAEFPIDLTTVRLFVSSGDALPASTYTKFLARFGRPIRSLYGSTEAGSIAIDMASDEQIAFGSVGSAISNVTIEIRDAQGLRLPVGVDGEIWVKSPTIPPTGYDGLVEANDKVFRHGFYMTGDIGHLNNQNQLILAGRRQSFINVAGYKVETAEVEAVLESYPGIREAAVLGVEVPRMGTLVKAAVVVDGPFVPSEIRAFCRQKLALYKVPRLIEALPELPRSPVGKILKNDLRSVEQYLTEVRGAESARLLAQLQNASPARKRTLTASFIHAQAAAVLSRAVAEVPRNTGFTELGMDSFASIELHARLEYLFEIELPQTFTFDHPTIDAATDGILDHFERTSI